MKEPEETRKPHSSASTVYLGAHIMSGLSETIRLDLPKTSQPGRQMKRDGEDYIDSKGQRYRRIKGGLRKVE